MSAFLGPIHHWLFNKIRLFEELERGTIVKLSESFGEDVKSLHRAAEDKFGTILPNAELGDLIDTDNIHGWLQNKIQIAETRQAFTYNGLLKKYGEAIIPILDEVYKQQGNRLGTSLREEAGQLSAVDLYKQLNNYLLDGMPCDHVNNVIESTPDKLVWVTTQCLHKPYWLEAGMDIEVMYALRFSWVRSFVEAANPAYSYKVDRNANQEKILHTIVLK